MYRFRHYFLVCMMAITLVSCGEEEGTYPSLVTQIANFTTNSTGKVTALLTDESVSHTILNTLYAQKPDTVYRALCTYVPETNGITLKGATWVWVLTPTKAPKKELPLTIVSAWRSGRYINLHLRLKHKEAEHSLSLSQDSIVGNTTYLSVRHPWVDDVDAWTADTWASIPIEEVSTEHITINNTYEFKR